MALGGVEPPHGASKAAALSTELQGPATREVAEGTRTPDHRDHNPGLYQLSYRHHAAGQDSPAAALANGIDQPIGRQPEGAPRRRAVVEHREMRRLEVAARLDADQLDVLRREVGQLQASQDRPAALEAAAR